MTEVGSRHVKNFSDLHLDPSAAGILGSPFPLSVISIMSLGYRIISWVVIKYPNHRSRVAFACLYSLVSATTVGL